MDVLKQKNHLEDYPYAGRDSIALLKNCDIVTAQRLQGKTSPKQKHTYLVKFSVLPLVVTPQLGKKILSMPNMPK